MVSRRYQLWVEEVKRANSLVELVSETGAKLRPSGRHEMVCCSPFRGEKDPSFRIYVQQESWWDYGAGRGGDQIDFWQALHDCDFRTAVDALASRVGMSWTGGGGNGAPKPDPEVEEEVTRLIERRYVEKISTEAAMYYSYHLPPKIRDWLQVQYGFEDDAIKKMRIGWGTGDLLVHLRDTLKYDVADILKTGLFIRTVSGRIIEHHEDRVTFPYWRNGTSPYMISRRVEGVTPDNEYQAAKYKKSLTKGDNHPYVSRHVRNDVFYGEDSVKKRTKITVITEGVTDCIASLLCGMPTISPVTVRFKKDDIDRAIRLTENADLVVIANDHELPKLNPKTGKYSQPGLDGAADTAKAMFEAGRNVRIAMLPLPDGQDKVDVASFVRDHGKKLYQDVIDGALTYGEFMIGRVPADTRASELDGALAPIYALISKCPPIERESYVNKLCERFGLSKPTITEAVDEFVRKQTKAPVPAYDPDRSTSDAGRRVLRDKAPTAPPTLPSPPSTTTDGPGSGGNDSGGNGNNGGGPSSGDDGGSLRPHGLVGIRGAVYEHKEQCYYYSVQYKEKEKDYEEIRQSNFVLRVKKKVKLPDGLTQFCCDVHTVYGRVIKDALLPARTFDSAKDMRRAMHEIDPDLTWQGNDNNTGAVCELLAEIKVPVFRGVTAVGYVATDDGPRFVSPSVVFGPTGTIENPNIMFCGQDTPPIAARFKSVGVDLPDEHIKVLAQRVVPKLFTLNTPAVIVPLIGWFYASCMATRIRETVGTFPVLWVFGTPGSGKSTVIKEVFWPLVGVEGEPFNCGDTKFALLKNFSSAVSVPLVYDEMKNMAMPQQQELQRLLLRSYIGDEEQRGRPDQRINRYHLRAPIAVISELMTNDVALLERIVCVAPMKTSISSDSRRLLTAVTSESLSLLGAHFHRWSMGLDIKELFRGAEAIMTASMLPQLLEPLSVRLRANLLAVVVGELAHQKWCDFLDVKIENRPIMKDVFRQVLGNITDDETGIGAVRDLFDRFFENLSTLAHSGTIVDGTHYTYVDGKLCLHLESCHRAYLIDRRRSGSLDETNGMAALRRVIREKEASGGSYIVDRHRRVHFDGKQIRCVVIDPDRVPGSLSVESFPDKGNRRRSDQKEFDGWN